MYVHVLCLDFPRSWTYHDLPSFFWRQVKQDKRVLFAKCLQALPCVFCLIMFDSDEVIYFWYCDVGVHGVARGSCCFRKKNNSKMAICVTKVLSEP